MIQKSYDNNSEGSLYIVPTPIGNKSDITLRGIEILKSVDIIYAEDTRTSSILLNMFDIKCSLKSCHLFNESKIKLNVVNELKSGKNIALITDQGTPIISDPGYKTVKYVSDRGFNVVALPGANAFVPALITSGIAPQPFLFYGWLLL